MISTRFPIVALAATGFLCLAGQPVAYCAAVQPSNIQASTQAPDNSNQNKAHSETADSQSNAKMDRQTTAKIRKAVVGDKDLSTYAHNVKIIAVNGEVTLKGLVQTDEEKQKVASIASSVVSQIRSSTT